MLLDVLIDLLATHAEGQCKADKMGPWEQFTAWQQALDTPPTFNLADHAAVREAVWGYFRAEFRKAVEKQTAGGPVTTSVAIEDDVPPGWENDTLLAQMQQAVQRGLG